MYLSRLKESSDIDSRSARARTGIAMLDKMNVTTWKNSGSIRVILRGVKFELSHSCMSRAPTSRLALAMDATEILVEGDVTEHVFDRCPRAFQTIYNFYVGDQLHLPSDICISLMIEELDFWGVEPELLSPCCWERYEEAREKEKALDKIRKEWSVAWFSEVNVKQLINKFNPDLSPTRHQMARFWIFIEIPVSGQGAKMWSLFFIGVVILSVIALCIDTMTGWRVAPDHIWQELANVTSHETLTIISRTSSSDLIWSVEVITLALLQFEAIARLICTPKLIFVLKCPFLWLSWIILIPSWMVVITDGITQGDKKQYASLLRQIYIACFCLRPLRLVFFLRLKNHYRSLYVLCMSLAASLRELGLLVLFLVLGVCFYGNLIYFVEIAEDNMTDVGQGFWWAMITMTTVGYGDTYPVSLQGRIIGSMCAVTGIIILALPIPVIANNFNRIYNCSLLIQKELIHKKLRKEPPTNDTLQGRCFQAGDK